MVEMLAAIAILTLIMVVVFGLTNQTARVWKNSTGKISEFQAARAGFDVLTQRLSQATLNTYYDYYDSSGRPASNASYSGTPTLYGRASELHFISGPDLVDGQIGHAVFFQAPLGYSDDASSYAGLNNALNAAGFYLIYNSDTDSGTRPAFITTAVSPSKYRFRLMQYTQPLQNLSVFTATAKQWFTNDIATKKYSYPLAENIVAMVIQPKRSTQDSTTTTLTTGDYKYDSHTAWSGSTQPVQMNQLPPLLHIVLVAIDENSAQRICTQTTAPDLGVSSLFKTESALNTDLKTLEDKLMAKSGGQPLNYRFFETDIALRGAKWSK